MTECGGGEYGEEHLLGCEYFHLRRISIPQRGVSRGSGLRIWSAIGGSGVIRAGEVIEIIRTGDTVMIPAMTEEVEVISDSGLEVIETGIGPGSDA